MKICQKDSITYVHVGRVGSFVPVIDGVGGGLLLRKNGDSYGAVVGTKGYRWKESDVEISW